MKQTVKKILSLLLVLLIAGSGLGVLSANAVTAYEILDKLAVLDSNGVQGTYGNLKPGSSYTNGQCWQYVKDISTYVFGQTMYIANTASYLSGADDNYYNVRQPVKNCGYDAIVNLLKLAQPGDLICLRNSKVDQTYGHIMFVGSVTTSRITVYQAASGYARKDTVDLTVSGLQSLYSFGYSGQASFYGSNYGVALFRSIKRTGQSDYSYGEPAQLFTTSGITLPSGKITQGQDFYVSGMIYCQKKIAWVGLAIVDLSTNQHIFETPANWPQTYNYDISGLNSMIDFGTLSPGRYRALLKAGTGQDEYMQNIPSDFEVVSPDTTAPQITSYGINQTDAYSYVVWCCFADNVGVTKVQFPTWTASKGQDDLIWYNGGFESDGKTACIRVWFKDHNNEIGDYISHIYVWDAAGNCSQVGTSILVERNAPVITGITITDRTTDGYTISCTIEDENRIKSVLFPTWTDENGQDDILWHEGTINGNTATCRISISDHNNDHGKYNTHVYAYDIWDNNSHVRNSCWVPSNEEMRTVSFDANGGQNPPIAQTGYVNLYESITIPETQPTRSGFSFLGWAESANAVTAQYQPGETVSPGKSLTLYAVWQKNEVTLQSIAVKTNPAKTTYTVGDTLDTAGLTLTAVYSDGSRQTVTNGFTCNPTKLNIAGQQTITVTYSGKTTSFVITVNNAAPTQSKVRAVSINDVTVNYKAKVTIQPIITADKNAKYSVKYESSNPNVASVDNNGKVGGLKNGTATITCTVTDEYGNTVSDTCKVTVNYTAWQWVIIILLFGWIWYI